MQNDNQGDVALNDNFVTTIKMYGEEMFEVGCDQASWLQAGENVITMTLTDWGGWVGYQYLIEFNFDATEGARRTPSNREWQCRILRKQPRRRMGVYRTV
jgi:hypothetical protein